MNTENAMLRLTVQKLIWNLGHYERFLNVPTSQANNVTTGKIYQSVINKKEKETTLEKLFRLYLI